MGVRSCSSAIGGGCSFGAKLFSLLSCPLANAAESPLGTRRMDLSGFTYPTKEFWKELSILSLDVDVFLSFRFRFTCSTPVLLCVEPDQLK